MTAVSKSIKGFILLLPPALICHLTRAQMGEDGGVDGGAEVGLRGGAAALKFKHAKTYKISTLRNYSYTLCFVLLFLLYFNLFAPVFTVINHKHISMNMVLENYKHPGVCYYF